MAQIEIRIELKKGVADPEGKNTMKTLESLGFEGVESVRSVKVFDRRSRPVRRCAGNFLRTRSFRITKSF